MKKKQQTLKSTVWGPHFWFFLHTIAYKYPESPNAVTKRKYYDLIVNFPLFIPDEEMGNHFATLLDKYPVSPYLDKRDSFVRWVWFIHNKINKELDKPEIELYDSIDKYLHSYSNSLIFKEKKWMYFIFWLLIIVLIVTFIILYN